MPPKKKTARSSPSSAKSKSSLSFEKVLGPAGASVLEALVWVLIDKGIIPKSQFQDEVERYAKMHETGERTPHDAEVARQMRFIARIPRGRLA
jgi:hypothetical protein